MAQPRGRSAVAARGRPGLDGVRPAAAGRSAPAARRPGGVATSAPARRRARRRTRADGHGRGRPQRGPRRRVRRRPGVDAARRGLRRRPGRRDRAARRRTGPARRPVRAHRRGRGAGTDRRGVADAAEPLPDRELHHRRGSCPGQARVHGVVAGTARADRAQPDQPRFPQHQLPDADGGHGGSRAGHPRRRAGRQRADLDPRQRAPRRTTDLPPIWTRSSTRGSPRMSTGSPASSAIPRSSRRRASGR